MNTGEADHVGFCTVCQTMHVTEGDFEKSRECENCGEDRVYSINEVSDMVNDYTRLLADYKQIEGSLNMGAYD